MKLLIYILLILKIIMLKKINDNKFINFIYKILSIILSIFITYFLIILYSNLIWLLNIDYDTNVIMYQVLVIILPLVILPVVIFYFILKKIFNLYWLFVDVEHIQKQDTEKKASQIVLGLLIVLLITVIVLMFSIWLITLV